jgi:PAS domain S-box-containing protein
MTDNKTSELFLNFWRGMVNVAGLSTWVKGDLLNLFFGSAFVIWMVFGALYIQNTWTTSNRKTSEKALKNASTIALSLNGETMNRLRAIPEDEGTTAYRDIKKRLIDLRIVLKEVRFMYIFQQKGDKLFFVIDSEQADSKDYSPPGQEYTEATAIDKQPFRDGKSLITSPSTDRWGTWVSVLVPIRNRETGEITSEFGMDYPADMWHKEAIAKTSQALFFALAILLLLIAFYIVIKKNLALKKTITDRKRAEEALQESEQTFKSLFEKGPVGIAYHRMIYDDSGKPVDYFIIEANPGYHELTGVNPTGKLVTEAFPGIENDPFDWIGTYGEVAKTGKEIRFQQCLQYNGRWYDCVGYRNKPDHFVSVILDITDSKLAEIEQKRKVERVLQTQMALIRIANMPVDNFDAYLGRIIEIIATTLDICRVSIWWNSGDHLEIICADLYDSLSGKHGQGERLTRNDFPRYFRALDEGRTIAADDAQTDERTVEFTDNYLVPLGITSMMDVPIRRGGEVIGIICHEHRGELKKWDLIEQDFAASVADNIVSALEGLERRKAEAALRESEEKYRLSEERYKSIISVSNTGAWEYHPDTDYLWCSPEYFAMLGLDPAWFHMDGRSNLKEAWFDLLHPEDREKAYRNFSDYVSRGSGLYENHFRMRHKDGHWAWIWARGQTLRDQGDSITNLTVGTHIDITQSKLAEQEIKKLNEDLEHKVSERTMQLTVANKELESFSYSVSHDLRAPLRALNGFASILLQDYSNSVDDEGKRFLQIIFDNAKKMGVLIDDLLNFSRLNRHELAFTKINMYEMANSVYRDLITQTGRRDIEFRLQSMPDAYADGAMVKQVWTNLISNAIKFTSKQPHPVIEIGGKTVDRETTYFVKDNGVGFDMAYSSKLFGVFQRLHSVKEFEGTGVGLSIVHRIIHRMNGQVWAEGIVDTGATFYFALPVKQ